MKPAKYHIESDPFCVEQLKGNAEECPRDCMKLAEIAFNKLANELYRTLKMFYGLELDIHARAVFGEPENEKPWHGRFIFDVAICEKPRISENQPLESK